MASDLENKIIAEAAFAESLGDKVKDLAGKTSRQDLLKIAGSLQPGAGTAQIKYDTDGTPYLS